MKKVTRQKTSKTSREVLLFPVTSNESEKFLLDKVTRCFVLLSMTKSICIIKKVTRQKTSKTSREVLLFPVTSNESEKSLSDKCDEMFRFTLHDKEHLL
ncbi:hypothetical protein D0T66_04120 [Dysgonomonas sp. 25]|nr:hypothetical protein [Dysgonomonas sp. 25]